MCVPGSKEACDMCKGSCKNNATTEEFSGDIGALKFVLVVKVLLYRSLKI